MRSSTKKAPADAYTTQTIKLVDDELSWSKRIKKLTRRLRSSDKYLILPRIRVWEFAILISVVMVALVVSATLATSYVLGLKDAQNQGRLSTSKTTVTEEPGSANESVVESNENFNTSNPAPESAQATGDDQELTSLQRQLQLARDQYEQELENRKQLEQDYQDLESQLDTVIGSKTEELDQEVSALTKEKRQLRNDIENLQTTAAANQSLMQEVRKQQSIAATTWSSKPIGIDVQSLMLTNGATANQFQFQAILQKTIAIDPATADPGRLIKIQAEEYDNNSADGYFRLVILGNKNGKDTRIYVPDGSLVRAKGIPVTLSTNNQQINGSFDLPADFNPVQVRAEVILYNKFTTIVRTIYGWSAIFN